MPMGKVQHRKLAKQEWEMLELELLETFGRLGLKRNGKKFLRDLLTKSEVVMISRRILIAKQLIKGRDYDEIARGMKVGFSTIQHVDDWLEQNLPSYRKALKPLKSKKKKGKGRLPADPYSLRGLRARYPSKFPILNFLLGDPKLYDDEESF